jgi:quinol---cytochrome c reductase iron-sulfur subunit, bacillus type
MTKSPNLSRNDFVKFTVGALGAVIGAVVGLPAIGYLISPALKIQKIDAWVQLGALENYPIGVPTLFTFTRTIINGWEKTVNSYGVYVLRKSESEVVVFSNVCTHLACRVSWKDDSQEFICPCHDGRFNINGEVVKDPPPRPLDRYETKIEDGNLSIRLLKG